MELHIVQIADRNGRHSKAEIAFVFFHHFCFVYCVLLRWIYKSRTGDERAEEQKTFHRRASQNVPQEGKPKSNGTDMKIKNAPGKLVLVINELGGPIIFFQQQLGNDENYRWLNVNQRTS